MTTTTRSNKIPMDCNTIFHSLLRIILENNNTVISWLQYLENRMYHHYVRRPQYLSGTLFEKSGNLRNDFYQKYNRRRLLFRTVLAYEIIFVLVSGKNLGISICNYVVACRRITPYYYKTRYRRKSYTTTTTTRCVHCKQIFVFNWQSTCVILYYNIEHYLPKNIFI